MCIGVGVCVFVCMWVRTEVPTCNMQLMYSLFPKGLCAIASTLLEINLFRASVRFLERYGCIMTDTRMDAYIHTYIPT